MSLTLSGCSKPVTDKNAVKIKWGSPYKGFQGASYVTINDPKPEEPFEIRIKVKNITRKNKRLGPKLYGRVDLLFNGKLLGESIGIDPLNGKSIIIKPGEIKDLLFSGGSGENGPGEYGFKRIVISGIQFPDITVRVK